MEVYAPTTKPISMAVIKNLIVTPPNRSRAINGMMVVKTVLMLRFNVCIILLFNNRAKESFLFILTFSRTRSKIMIVSLMV